MGAVAGTCCLWSKSYQFGSDAGWRIRSWGFNCRGEADASLNCGRSTPSASDISQGWCSAVHGGHDEQVDIAEEGIELATKRLPAMPDLGHRKPVEGTAGLQQSGEHWTVFGGARWI